MKKQILLFVMMLLPLVASAHDIAVQNADGVTIYYNYTNDGKELEVTFRGSSATDYPFEYTGNIVIPESVNYNNVTYSVTSISEDAFEFCSGLTSVTIGNNVTSIGNYAFNQCSGLTSITIPKSVTSIGAFAFYGCYGLTSITIPNSVTSIGDDAFYGCYGLTSITIPNSVTSIGDGAFKGCRGLTSIEIPNSVTSIGISAFSGCSSLTSVTINSNAVVSKNYSSTSSLKDIFGTQVKEYILGDEVQSIGNYAFYGCSGLTSFTIPNNVTSIGEDAFRDCTALQKVIVSDITTWCGIKFGNTYANPLYYAKHLYSDENTEITDLKIPNSVTSIGNYAFSDCSGLTSVTIPNSVTSIGDRAFSGCIGLTSVTIGNSVTSIGDQAFNSCRGLTSIEIPNSVTSIGDGAFSGCSSLTSVTINSNAVVSQNYSSTSSLKDIFGTQVKEYIIGNEVHGIGESAFEGSSGLISVTIPNNIISIGIAAFSGCSGLTSVTVEDGNSTYDSRNNCNAIIETATNMLVAGCKNTVIPNSVTSISYKAFFGCSGLTSVTIPNCVTSIGEQAFSGCSSLTSVTINSNAVVSQNYSYPSSLKQIFGNQVRKYIIGNEVQSIGDYAFSGCSSLTSIEIPNSVTSIGYSAFNGCSSLTSIEIPNSVTSIGNRAFLGCSSLTSVTIGNSVTSIGYSAFNGCSSLTSIEIPNSVTSIGNNAFNGCYGLTSITIPNSVTSIGDGAFFGCSRLTSIEIPNSVTSIGQSAFNGCSGLTSIEIPNSVASIGESAFEGCSGLTSVYIPNRVTSIGRYAFIGCSSLTSVTIIGNTEDLYGTSVGESAFEGCKSLTSITIGKGVRSIGVNAFYRCKGLTSIDIPNGVKFIYIYAFMDCSNLRTVTLGNSVTSIGGKAFYGCSSLTSVKVYAKTPPTAGQVAFPNYDHAIKLYVPRGSKASYAAANVWKDFSSINVFGVMVTADDLTMVYGDAVPELTYKTEGGSLTGTPQITCEATSTSPVGTYPIVISKGTIDSDEVTYVNGKLTITKAPLTITAKSYTIKQGDALPTFEAEYAGFKNNETNEVLTKKPTITTSATSASAPGAYEIVVSGAEAQNYDITYVKGTLTIEGVMINGIFYGFNGEEAMVVANPSKYQGNVVVPASVNYNGKEYSVTSIGNNAFNGCSGLTSITIPNSVTSIGNYAFSGCSALTSVKTFSKIPPTVEIDAFPTNQTITLYVPRGSKAAYESADIWKGFSSIVEFKVEEPYEIGVREDVQAKGRQVSFSIDLKNETTDLTAYQFDMTLPDGFSLSKDEKGKFLVTKTNRYEDDSHTLTISKLEGNTYRFVCFSMSNEKISGTSGAILNVALAIGESVKEGKYEATISNVTVTKTDETQLKLFDEKFNIIVNFIKGDANGDGEVNVTDIVEIVNYIMNKPSEKFIFSVADMNDDGEVNVSDIVKVVSLIMSSSSNAPRRASVVEIVDNDQLEMTCNDNQTLSLNLQNEGNYVASQFDVVLSAGQTLENIQLNNKRMENHQMIYAKTADNRYKVVIYSLNNATYNGHSGELLNIKVAGSGEVSVEDILFITAGQMEKWFSPLQGGTTGISVTTKQTEKMDIYSTDGRLVRKQAESTNGLKKGLYIINGKKHIVR